MFKPAKTSCSATDGIYLEQGSHSLHVYRTKATLVTNSLVTNLLRLSLPQTQVQRHSLSCRGSLHDADGHRINSAATRTFNKN